MSSAPIAALVVLLTLAGVLFASGASKLRDPRSTRDGFDALRVPDLVPADAAARTLPVAEIALGALLLVAPTILLVPVAVIALLLMLAYTALIARALGFEEPVTCSCFGNLGRHHVDRATLGRNVLLTALAAGAVWFALDGGSAPDVVQHLDGAGWATVVAAVAAVAVAVLVVGGAAKEAPAVPDDELLDYERRPIPYGVVTLADGSTATLAELARTQARLILIFNPGCGPCVRIGAKLDAWSARLAPAVGILAIYPDEAAVRGVTGHAAELAAWEPEYNVRRVYDVPTPTAVLLGADGLMAGGPVVGEDEVEAIVAEISAELSVP